MKVKKSVPYGRTAFCLRGKNINRQLKKISRRSVFLSKNGSYNKVEVTDMKNINIVLAANILKFRKLCGMTQSKLAEKLSVSSQSVSKWETAKAAPDISLLPMLADIFDCHIDQLFSR